jgi:hypothetical protein
MPAWLPGEYVPSGIPPGPAGITFGEGTIAGTCADVRHIIKSPVYNNKAGI